MSKVETLKVLHFLRTAYPHIERDKTPDQVAQMFDIYLELLDDLDPDLLKVAARQYIAEGKWFPSVAELRDGVAALIEQANRQNGASIPTAAEAWQQLGQVLHMDGWNARWDNGARERLHPIVIECAKAFGERRFVTRLEDDEGTNFAQWRDTYEAMAKRHRAGGKMLAVTQAAITELAEALRADGPRRLSGARAGNLLTAKDGSR